MIYNLIIFTTLETIILITMLVDNLNKWWQCEIYNLNNHNTCVAMCVVNIILFIITKMVWDQ